MCEDDGIDLIDNCFTTGAETGTLANHKGSETRESVIGLRVQRKVIVARAEEVWWAVEVQHCAGQDGAAWEAVFIIR